MSSQKKPVVIEYKLEQHATAPKVVGNKLIVKALVKPHHSINKTKKLYIKPGEQQVISTGLKLTIPKGYQAYIEVSTQQIAQGIDVVSQGFRETEDLVLNVVVFNHSPHMREIADGDEIGYLFLVPVIPIEAHAETKE